MKKKTNTLGKLRARERETRRNLILNAAERVFAAIPFHEVSMRKIALEAGISTASVYTYFPDQETLFVEAYLRRIQEILGRIERIVEEHGADSLEEIVGTYIEYFTERDAYFRMMAHFMLYARLKPDSLTRLNETVRAALDFYEAVFARMSMGEDQRLCAHLFLAALNGILISFRKYPGRSEAEVMEHMKRLGHILASLFRAWSSPSPELPGAEKKQVKK